MNANIPQRPALILIIDDDLFVQMQLRLYLEKEGYQIAIANHAEEGLEAYTRHHPDLVLLDAIMPGMDGFECCTQLMAQPRSHHTPILMITSLDDQESVDRAFAAGATDYVTKPIHWAVLRQRVRRLLHQVQLQQDLEAANQVLQRLVSLDGLTQVNNRRRFDECLQQEWLRMSREHLPLSLILCDIDCFKSYNDTYGHQAGDDCLKRVAQAISFSVKRPADLVARYGGEEFGIILPNTPLAGATCVAEEMRLTVKRLEIPHISCPVSSYVTLSLGVGCFLPQPDITCEVLVAATDKALYQAKAQGRDRTCTVDWYFETSPGCASLKPGDSSESYI